jgi:hypothetical protein
MSLYLHLHLLRLVVPDFAGGGVKGAAIYSLESSVLGGKMDLRVGTETFRTIG